MLPRRKHASRSILIASWHFPPFVGTSVQMVNSIARIAAEQGWRVTIVSAPREREPSSEGVELERENVRHMRVLRAPGRVTAPWGLYFMSPSERIFPVVDGGFGAVVAMCWRALTALWSSPPSVVLASGPVFANMVAASHLAKMFRAALVLHYRDEWTVGTPTFVAVDDRSRAVERDCLRNAALLWFVHAPQPALYSDAMPWLRYRPYIVAPNGWDETVFERARPNTHHLDALKGRFVLAFVGRATASSPLTPILTDLRHLSAEIAATLTFAIIGDQPPQGKAELQELKDSEKVDVWEHGRVKQTTAVEIMHEASALLLLSNTRYQGLLPLKIFDYMASNAPILVYGPDGPCASVIKGTGAGVHVMPGDTASLDAAIRNLRLRPREFWSTPARADWVTQHERRRIVQRALDAIAAKAVQPARA